MRISSSGAGSYPGTPTKNPRAPPFWSGTRDDALTATISGRACSRDRNSSRNDIPSAVS